MVHITRTPVDATVFYGYREGATGVYGTIRYYTYPVQYAYTVRMVPASEFRRSLRVLHTHTDVRVDTRTSGDVEFLVLVSAWILVTSEFMHGGCYVFAFWGFQANTSLLF